MPIPIWIYGTNLPEAQCSESHGNNQVYICGKEYKHTWRKWSTIWDMKVANRNKLLMYYEMLQLSAPWTGSRKPKFSESICRASGSPELLAWLDWFKFSFLTLLSKVELRYRIWTSTFYLPLVRLALCWQMFMAQTYNICKHISTYNGSSPMDALSHWGISKTCTVLKSQAWSFSLGLIACHSMYGFPLKFHTRYVTLTHNHFWNSPQIYWLIGQKWMLEI